MSAQNATQQPFLFTSQEGNNLCRNILSQKLPYHPHDVQIEGICKLLDGVDTLAILHMSMGKTGFLSMYMLVLLEILKHPHLYPSVVENFPKKPCMLVVLPTKYLEHQMVRTSHEVSGINKNHAQQADRMNKLALQNLVVNADTIAAARLKGDDLWKQAGDEPHMIFMAPEQLISKDFGDLVKEGGTEMLYS